MWSGQITDTGVDTLSCKKGDSVCTGYRTVSLDRIRPGPTLQWGKGEDEFFGLSIVHSLLQ